MGQNQSNARPGQQEGETKVDYYELLDVDRQATDEEIKKAYRRKALELHPDRNYGNVEDATRLFAEIQSAYEVLSDPQERAWYDSHRDAILRSDDPSGGPEYVYNVRLTSAYDILRLVARFNGRVQFTDAPSSFFGGLRETFENLAREEELACEWEGLDAVDYPPFGHADDGFEEVVKPFYAVWNGFATRKTFSWKDIYRYSEAPDRRVRRIMEKENKRLRDEGIREFNDAVRSLVAFIRKRDPRYKANSQSEAERQKVLRDAAQAQAARSRAANQAKLAGDQALPDWAKTDGPQEDLSSEEESEQEEFECVVCNKTFKSEKQYQAHERSKKHVKAVKLLRHEMKKENRILDLEDDESSIPMTPEPEAEEDQPKVEGNDAILNPRDEARGISSTGSDEAEEDSTPDQLGHRDASSLLPSEQNDCGYPPPSDFSDDDHQDLDEDYAPREEIAHRMTNAADNDLSDRLATFTLDNNSDATPKKMGKAKQKRAKKAARKSVPGEAGSELKCAACQTGFPSKTRLFKHIKKLGHAQPAMTGSWGKKAKGPGKQDAGEG